MSSAQDPTKASTAQETEKEQNTVAETIAYARRTYKGNHPDAKTFEPENNGGIKKFLNNITHTLTANRYALVLINVIYAVMEITSTYHLDIKPTKASALYTMHKSARNSVHGSEEFTQDERDSTDNFQPQALDPQVHAHSEVPLGEATNVMVAIGQECSKEINLLPGEANWDICPVGVEELKEVIPARKMRLLRAFHAIDSFLLQHLWPFLAKKWVQFILWFIHTYSDNSGTYVHQTTQEPGQAPREERFEIDSNGRRIVDGSTSGSNAGRITDVSDEQQKENDRLYEERMEEEYAKREGGA
ncbi:hypothetical protein E8E12_010653 [Didymella heteroderae]|uniref:Uncharacterized protein n=1 Tax=Didymella heteroderae TaxID=1769908 RepID=A0A9P5C3I9_9PLEO|nr:hypothetical protein E8E12_010653 [Didymella heteroderae]